MCGSSACICCWLRGHELFHWQEDSLLDNTTFHCSFCVKLVVIIDLSREAQGILMLIKTGKQKYEETPVKMSNRQVGIFIHNGIFVCAENGGPLALLLGRGRLTQIL